MRWCENILEGEFNSIWSCVSIWDFKLTLFYPYLPSPSLLYLKTRYYCCSNLLCRTFIIRRGKKCEPGYNIVGLVCPLSLDIWFLFLTYYFLIIKYQGFTPKSVLLRTRQHLSALLILLFVWCPPSFSLTLSHQMSNWIICCYNKDMLVLWPQCFTRLVKPLLCYHPSLFWSSTVECVSSVLSCYSWGQNYCSSQLT